MFYPAGSRLAPSAIQRIWNRHLPQQRHMPVICLYDGFGNPVVAVKYYL